MYALQVTSCTKDPEVLKNPQFLGEQGQRTMFQITLTRATGIVASALSAVKREAEVAYRPLCCRCAFALCYCMFCTATHKYCFNCLVRAKDRLYRDRSFALQLTEHSACRR
jgi:hypothetical protein